MDPDGGGPGCRPAKQASVQSRELARTEAIVRRIRSMHAGIPIIATGGKDEFSILNAIRAGANAITYTPPSAGDLLRAVMDKYRQDLDYPGPGSPLQEGQPGEWSAGV